MTRQGQGRTAAPLRPAGPRSRPGWRAQALPAVSPALCRRRLRFARLGWIVTALDLLFLIPWWIGGLAVHGAGLHAMQLLTMWLPLALMAGFVAWTRALQPAGYTWHGQPSSYVSANSETTRS